MNIVVPAICSVLRCIATLYKHVEWGYTVGIMGIEFQLAHLPCVEGVYSTVQLRLGGTCF